MSRVVYFVQRESDGLVKIGFTKNLRERLYGLASEHGELELLGIVDGGRVREKVLHLLFEMSRVEGEFFRLTDKLEAFIEAHTYIPEPTRPGPAALINSHIGGVTVIVTLKEHLAALEAEEGRRPPDQHRPVPDLPELAGTIGFSRQEMYNFAGGELKMVNLSTLSAIISELRGRGFPTDVGDILVAYPSDTVEDRSS